jgi:hypothetical protein
VGGGPCAFLQEVYVTTIRKLNAVPVSEASIQKAIRDYLELDGWRVFETDATRWRRDTRTAKHPLKEPGMADLLALRYDPPAILWIEVKRKGGRVEPQQRFWHFAERLRGATVIVLGQDCEASIDGWLDWYAASGLMRRCLAA